MEKMMWNSWGKQPPGDSWAAKVGALLCGKPTKSENRSPVLASLRQWVEWKWVTEQWERTPVGMRSGQHRITGEILHRDARTVNRDPTHVYPNHDFSLWSYYTNFGLWVFLRAVIRVNIMFLFTMESKLHSNMVISYYYALWMESSRYSYLISLILHLQVC